MFRASCIFLFLMAAVPTLAAEAAFDVQLAGATLGRITVVQSGDQARLSTVMDNTPLGVGDGRFDATYSGDAFRSLGQSPGEQRRIDFDYDGSRVARVDITPEDEATDASDPAAVPDNVLDPARGFARIALAPDCVQAFRIYDGRRVVQVTPTARDVEDETLSCRYAYRVIGGPGHLSPFRFRNVSMVARYALDAGASARLYDIALGAGPFTVRLLKR